MLWSPDTRRGFPGRDLAVTRQADQSTRAKAAAKKVALPIVAGRLAAAKAEVTVSRG